jgi:hypothetical protein
MALVRDMVREAVARHASRTALVTDRVSYTYAELGERIRRLAAAFDEEGVLPTDIVGFVLAYRPELLYEIRFATYSTARLFVIPPHLPPEMMIPMLRAVSRASCSDPDQFPDFRIAREAIQPAPLRRGGGDFRGDSGRESEREQESRGSRVAGRTRPPRDDGIPKGVTATHAASAGIAPCSIYRAFSHGPRAHRLQRGALFTARAAA